MTIDWAQLAAVAAVMTIVAAGIRFMIAKMLADFQNSLGNQLRKEFMSREEMAIVIDRDDEAHRRIDASVGNLWDTVNEMRNNRRPSR